MVIYHIGCQSNDLVRGDGMRKMRWEEKEDIYKTYQHGGTIKKILTDFDIDLSKFKRIMHEIGGPEFHAKLFDKATGTYAEK